MKTVDSRGDWILTAMPLAYLIALLVFSSIDRPFIWGANHLRYHPGWVWAVCSVLLVGVSLPAVRTRLLAQKLLAVSYRLQYVLMLVIAALGFFLLHNATHLLGDGYLLARELDSGLRKIANEPLSFWLLHRARTIVGTGSIPSDYLYFAWSFVSGIAYVALVPVFAKQVTGSDRSRAILSVFLFLPGYIQLFFGYHETYPILYPLLLVYAWAGVRARENELPAWTPCLVLCLLILLHFTMATLIPSLLLILGGDGDLRRRTRNVLSRLGSVVPTVLAGASVLWFVGFDVDVYLTHAGAETLLPLFAPADHSIPYGALSTKHLVEFASEILLVFLPTLMALPFLTRSFVRSRVSLFLLSAAVPAWVTTFFGYTVIGAFRDWDALAFPALFTTIWAGLGILHSSDVARVRQICCVIVVVAGVNTLLWITVNADTHRSTRRFEDALEYSHLSTRARSYGWETLGGYYLEVNALGPASISYQNAIENDPRHPRYPTALGFILMQVGDYAGAARNFRRSTSLDPDRYEAWLNLGLALIQTKEGGAAVEAMRRAAEIRPDIARIPFALGVAYYALEDYKQAIIAYEQATALQSDYVSAYFNLAQLHGLVGDNHKKRDSFVRVLTLQPDHHAAPSIREWLVWYKGQSEIR
jgi:cytochrome c-type biogenesis protein CcmH/NrfG